MPVVDGMIETGTPAPVGQDFLDRARAGLAAVRLDEVIAIANVLADARRRRARVFVLGNGGSAATAAHLACDLSKGAGGERRLRVAALSEAVPTLTAWANDVGYEQVFAEQLYSLVDPGDVVLALSVSARSASVVAGMQVARRLEAYTMALLGPDLGALDGLLDFALHVPSDDYGVVETAHLAVVHAVTAMLRGRRLTLAVDGPVAGRELPAPEPARPFDG